MFRSIFFGSFLCLQGISIEFHKQCFYTKVELYLVGIYIWKQKSPKFETEEYSFEYVYHHSNPRLQFRLKLEYCKPRKAVLRHPTKCDVINDAKLFPTVYTVAHFGGYPIRCRVKTAT